MKRWIVLVAAFLLLTPSSSIAEGKAKKVELFVTSWCPYCTKLEGFLKKEKIDYTRYDVEADVEGARLFESIGGSGVPVTFIDRAVIVPGYDPEGVLEALKSKK